MTAISVPSGFGGAVRDRLSGRFKLLHGGAPSVHISDDGAISSPPPIASSIMGFEDEVEQSLRRPYR